MPIDAKFTMNMFRVNGVKDECPACGKEGWRFGNDFVSLSYAKAADDASGASGTGIRAVPIICNNCKYIRLFVEQED